MGTPEGPKDQLWECTPRERQAALKVVSQMKRGHRKVMVAWSYIFFKFRLLITNIARLLSILGDF
jgi:hypothetical protein